MATIRKFEDLEVWKKSRELDKIQDEFEDIYNRCTEISRMLQGFMDYLQNSDIKGSKYIRNKRTLNVKF